MELEAVKKENKMKSTSLPPKNFSLDGLMNSGISEEAKKLCQSWEGGQGFRSDQDLSKSLMGTSKQIRLVRVKGLAWKVWGS